MDWKSDPKVRNIAEWSDDTRIAKWPSGLVIRQTHLSDACYGDWCPIHKPREHDLDHLEMVFISNSLVRVKEDGSMVPDPDDYRYNKGDSIILRNSAHCNHCDTDIESMFTHDFMFCKCDSNGLHGVAVDGGHDYLRRLNGRSASYEDTSVVARKMD